MGGAAALPWGMACAMLVYRPRDSEDYPRGAFDFAVEFNVYVIGDVTMPVDRGRGGVAPAGQGHGARLAQDHERQHHRDHGGRHGRQVVGEGREQPHGAHHHRDVVETEGPGKSQRR